MSNPYKIYIQQLAYDGISYTSGKPIDTLDKFNIVCEECPFILFPESKEPSSRNWVDEDGLDEYIPQYLPLKEYDINIKFLYNRVRNGQTVTDNTIRSDIKSFISFLYGRSGSGITGDTVQSARLAIWSEDTGIGRKDIRVKKVHNSLFYHTRYDDEVICEFEITFQVNDPATDVNPQYTDGIVTQLVWE